MGATLFSGHPGSGIKFDDGKFDWKTRLHIKLVLNLNNAGWGAHHKNITAVIHVSCMQNFTHIIENLFCS